MYLINTHNGVKDKNISKIEIKDYPTLKKHLDEYWQRIEKRADQGDTPYNLRNCAYLEEFNKPKVIYPETTQGAYFAYDDKGFYIDKTCFMLISEKYAKYLQITLSSKLFSYAYKHIFSSIELGESAYQYNKHALVKLPVYHPQNNTEISFSSDNEEEINHKIYKLYNLSQEEIRFIDSQTQ